MKSWTGLFGKRPPHDAQSSPVRTRFHRERGSKRGRLMIVFSPEVLEVMGWKSGVLLDLQSDGMTLVIAPSPGGRTLHYDHRTIGLAIDEGDLSKAREAFGFDATQKQFWDRYTYDGDKLVLLLRDMGVPCQ